jgi:cell division protein FtsL
MKRTTMIVWLCAVGAAALVLFHVKQQVKEVEQQLAAVEARILEHQEAIHVLDAEWAYRTRPTRIARLAEEYLGLGPLPSDAIIGISQLPWRGDDAPTDPSTTPAVPPGAGGAQAFLASAETGR